ncbi:MAG: hypothetical protein HUJ56_00855, partial [Erysipelotrichaceae bacterium]|nr:hypothetical protein [Erysipelotrichaceae bacterium]
ADSPEFLLPPITIKNTNLPNAVQEQGYIDFPPEDDENALAGLYDYTSPKVIDFTNWLGTRGDEVIASNRREADIRDKVMKVRIRYSGKELAIIDFLNTIYEISFA